MKKAINIILYTLCVTAMTYLASCSKGDDGAQGPPGPAGSPGPAGPAGPAGPGVIYSEWSDTLTYFPFTDTTGGVVDTLGYFGDINAPGLTLDILNKGEVKVYANFGTDTDPLVLALPFTNGLFFYIDAIFFLNTIEVSSNADLTGLPLRYILIPGSDPARNPNSIDWNDYKQVQKYLGLKD